MLYGILGRCLEALCGCRIIACNGSGASGLHPEPFDRALLGTGGTKLSGTPTYRMPRHPMYKVWLGLRAEERRCHRAASPPKEYCHRHNPNTGVAAPAWSPRPPLQDMFANPMYKPIWFKAFGLNCFTRLVRRVVSRANLRLPGWRPALAERISLPALSATPARCLRRSPAARAGSR
jgi:hypothetical protein